MGLLAFMLVLSLAGSAFASTNKTDLSSLARQAVSTDAGKAATAIQALRAQGPVGLDAFLTAHADAIKARRMEIASANPPAANASWLRVSAAMDAIAGQKDSFASELFWYTDFDQARAAARLNGKPILSLRLLGRLDEELSCANSRFFRLTLYSNQEISRLLKEGFILHWQSVRPAPKVTIDFGDGRRLERTLTGNSIHYVLDSQGRVVDALPGLYGPRAFLSELIRAANLANQVEKAPTDEARTALLRDYHKTRLNELAVEWTSDLTRAGIKSPITKAATQVSTDSAKPPRAEVAARAAMTKMVVVERPILRGISTEPRLLDAQPEDRGWARIAALHTDDATLDNASRALVRSKNLSRFAAADEWQRTLATLERAIAIDTVRNEYLFRRTLHEWMADAGATDNLAALNERVYAELFLTPSSDKWLGLFPDDSFTGIENDGVRK
jgi:DNA-binding transcriptional regulator/RsmH inhibitor MraZ